MELEGLSMMLINLIEELQIQELGKIAQVLLCILNKLKILNE